jgi:GT2 family glycosyltransferase
MSSVCAIVSTYNRANYLPIALDSILRQSRPVDEIIIVDDGSKDDTLKALEPFRDRATIVTQVNAGKATALNNALSRTKADYIWIFDDDDIADDDGIRPLVEALDADPTLDFAYGMHKYFIGERMDDMRFPDFWAQPGPDRTLIDFLGNLFPFQAATVARREIFERIGNFNTDFARCQDVEAMIRMALHGKAIYLPHMVFYQRVHEGARFIRGGQMSAKEALQRAVQYAQKALLLHRDEMAPDHLVPLFATSLGGDLQRRAAYLARACLFARSALWSEAVADLTEAARASSAAVLPQELARAGVMINMGHMWDLLSMDPANVRALARFGRGSDYGRAILPALLRPMIWLTRAGFKEEGFSVGWRRLSLLLRLIGPGGCLKLVRGKVLKRPAALQPSQAS